MTKVLPRYYLDITEHSKCHPALPMPQAQSHHARPDHIPGSAVDDRRGHPAERAHAAGAPAGGGGVAAAPHELRLPDQLPGGVAGQQRRRVREAPRVSVWRLSDIVRIRVTTAGHYWEHILEHIESESVRASVRGAAAQIRYGLAGGLFGLRSRPA